MTDEELQAASAIERAVIGRVIHDATVLDSMPPLDRDDFVDPKAEAMWSAVMNLVGDSRRIDHLAVDAELARMGRLDALGGQGAAAMWMYEGMALQEYSTALHAKDIRQRGIAKRVLFKLTDLLARARREGMDGDELISEAQGVLNRVSVDSVDSTMSIGDAVDRRVRELEALEDRRRNGEKVLTGLPTGIERLDARIGGWQVGIVQLLCGRPSMGKSSALLSSMDACSAEGIGAHLFTLEDSAAAHSDRAMSRTSNVPSSNIRALRLDQSQFQALAKAQGELRRRQGWLVDERAGITADEIVRSARKHAKKNKTKLVAVDYANLVKASGRGDRGAHESLTEIITTFATSAKNDGFAYLVLAQLNRSLEARDDKRPRMSDLRESGSLEERSKLIVSVYRGYYYTRRPLKGIDWDPEAPEASTMPKVEPTEDEYKRTVQLGVIKNNNGPTGTIFASWDGPTTKVW